MQAVLSGGFGGDAALGYWSPTIRDGVLAMQAGQLHAAQRALAGAPIFPKIGANIAQGFHHAWPLRGKGYCTFNGLALIALAHPTKSIVVLDVDEHEGDGTSVFATTLPNLFNATVFGTPMGGPHDPQGPGWIPGSQGTCLAVLSKDRDGARRKESTARHWLEFGGMHIC